MTITEFLLARIAEDEAEAHRWAAAMERDETEARGVPAWVVMAGGVVVPARVLAECEAKRRIVEFHESWPVLVQQPPQFEQHGGDFDSMRCYTMTQRIAWTTQEEYRRRFGDEPPTAPMLAAMAAIYRDHPDYDTAWDA